MLHIAIVEDNQKAGKILKEYLESEDLRVTEIYASGEDALTVIPTLTLPDIILMDIGLPDISGIEVTRRLKEKYPDLEIVIQTIFEDTKIITEAIKAGASGYILKASPKNEIIKALWDIKNGGSYLSAKIARKVLQELRTTEGKGRSLHEFGLTGREEEILKEIINGTSYKTIASNLGISIHTINSHTRKIYEKLRVNSRGEAVAKVIR